MKQNIRFHTRITNFALILSKIQTPNNYNFKEFLDSNISACTYIRTLSGFLNISACTLMHRDTVFKSLLHHSVRPYNHMITFIIARGRLFVFLGFSCGLWLHHTISLSGINFSDIRISGPCHPDSFKDASCQIYSICNIMHFSVIS